MDDISGLDQAGFAAKSNVSRETLQDYAAWYGLLRKWNARINLPIIT